ncbi:hypothetical protein [Dongia sp.]|uniref:hypothetical protein n=1 Tax=Dongia sp. TaxID=1977262 RepID=UPI003753E2FD
MFKRVTFASALLASMGDTLPASAFEVDGFKSGMTESEALERPGAAEFARGKSDPENRAEQYVAQSPLRVLTFCDKELIAYQRDFSSDWHSFVQALEKASRDFGAGSNSERIRDVAGLGTSSVLSMVWERPGGDLYEIARGQVGDNAAQNYEYYFAPNKCFKRGT